MLTFLLVLLHKIGITSVPTLSQSRGPTSPHALQRREHLVLVLQRMQVAVRSANTRLEIHVASLDRTIPKHDVSRSHRNIASHVVLLRAARRKPKQECNIDEDVDIDRAKTFDILSDLIFALMSE